MLKRIGLILLASLLLVGLTAAPSSAKSRVVHDPRGDAHHGAQDLTKVRFSNARHAVRVKGHFYAPQGTPFDCATLAFGRKGGLGYNARACLRGRHATHRLFKAVRRHGDVRLVRVKCRAMKSRWSLQHASVQIVVPRRCLKRKRLGAHRTAMRLYTQLPKHLDRSGDHTRTVKVRRG